MKEFFLVFERGMNLLLRHETMFAVLVLLFLPIFIIIGHRKMFCLLKEGHV